MKRLSVPILILSLVLLLTGCGDTILRPRETVDPYAGMVQVESGFGIKMWVDELEGVPVNDLKPEDFSAAGRYIGDGYTVTRGVDVSEHQGAIDWAAASQDVDFAILRAGYRGYGERGLLRTDEQFEPNITGALAQGVAAGIYFFSQAVSPEEAEEEADYLLALMEPYGPEKVTLPVYYDWEDIAHDTARTDGMDGETVTACALAFCARVAEAGYRTGIYAYRYLGYFSYDLRKLTEQSLWIGAIGSYPDFYYAHEIWQYSSEGNIHGIEGPVDLDLRFQRKEAQAEGDKPSETTKEDPI